MAGTAEGKDVIALVYLVIENGKLSIATKNKSKAEKRLQRIKNGTGQMFNLHDNDITHRHLDLHLGQGVTVSIAEVLDALE